MDTSARVLKLRERIKSEGIQVMVITDPTNRRYLTDFTGSHGIVVITENYQLLITDARYTKQAAKQALNYEIIDQGRDDWLSIIAAQIKRLSLSTGAFEASHLTVDIHQSLLRKTPDFVWRSTTGYVENLRSVKDDQEIINLRNAARIADEAFNAVARQLAPGMTELKVAHLLYEYVLQNGGEGMSFSTIVAAGKRSALPHGVATDAKLEAGDMVTLDFGAIYKGYCSDITRTVVLGEPTKRQRELHAVVLQAQNEAIAKIQPGCTAKEIDAAARNYIVEKGYGKFFLHSTGHGIGLCVHERPSIGQRKSSMHLVPGMVITIEPGIYLEDQEGIRIEDDILVTEAGAEYLTKAPRSLGLPT